MFVVTINYTGLASDLSYHHRRNLWKGTAPFGRAMRQSYGEGLMYWYEEMLPGHFEKGASRKYGHQKRKAPYLRIKRRLAKGYPSRGRNGEIIRGRHARVIRGGMVDIVRSGTTERVATRGVVTVVAGTRQGVLTFNVPFYITQRSRTGQPNQAEELKTIVPEEERELNEVMGRAFFKALNEEGRRARARKFVPR